MRVNPIMTVAVCVAILSIAGETPAQGLFGGLSRPMQAIQPPRSLSGLSGSVAAPRDSRAGGLGTLMEETAESVGQMTDDKRFLRGNRAAGDFVGTDSGDKAGFIGSAAADNSGPIRSATTGSLVRTTTGPAINRTRVKAPAPYMYEARLRIGFDVNPQSLPTYTTKVVQRLMRVRAIDPASSFEVKLEGSTAILSGTVGSAREKSLAGLLLTFEPGISNVKNELVVRRPLPTPSHSPSNSEPSQAGDS